MKICSIFALIATVAADANDPTDTAHSNSANWQSCSTTSDCTEGFFCCGITKTEKGSAPTTATKVCTCKSANGVIPTDINTIYAGYQYFCTLADHGAIMPKQSAKSGASMVMASGLVTAASLVGMVLEQ